MSIHNLKHNNKWSPLDRNDWLKKVKKKGYEVLRDADLYTARKSNNQGTRNKAGKRAMERQAKVVKLDSELRKKS